MENVWKRYVKQWRYMRGCKSIQKHVKIYNIFPPTLLSLLLHIIQMFSILLHTLCTNLHIFWRVLHIFVEWFRKNEYLRGKLIKGLYQLRNSSFYRITITVFYNCFQLSTYENLHSIMLLKNRQMGEKSLRKEETHGFIL